MRISFGRYLGVFALVLVTVVGVVWVYAALAPMAFMESGYASWAAKATMLRECRLGQVALFGDSRLEAGVMPTLLPVPASNFGLAAGTPIEAQSAVARALECPALPKQAVLSFVPEHFGPLSQYFWLLSLRYGFLQPGEVWAVEQEAASLGDRETLATPTPDGLGGPVRDWLYAVRFPSLSFSSLVQGRIFGRLASNRARYAEVLQDRGWAAYGGGEVGQDRPEERFVATRLQRAAFERAIGQLRARGVSVSLLVMPFSQSQPPAEAVAREYVAYLREVAARFPGVELIDGGVPIWPARLFADGAHLRPEGARALSERLAGCISGGTIASPCDLGWTERVGAAQ